MGANCLFVGLKLTNYYRYNQLAWSLEPFNEKKSESVVLDIFIDNDWYKTIDLHPHRIGEFQNMLDKTIGGKYIIKNINYDQGIHIYLIKSRQYSTIKIQWNQKKSTDDEKVTKNNVIAKKIYKNIIIHEI
jgi:hypothetical protein